MDFNTFLFRLGLNPADFVNKPVEAIKSDDGFVYELEQLDGDRICPHCHSTNCYIKEYKIVKIYNNEVGDEKEIIYIKKIRYKCRKCKKTFTKPIRGIKRYDALTERMKNIIFNDLLEPVSFSSVARKHSISLSETIKIFDDRIKEVPRLYMPEVMCIDEIKFSDSEYQKYVVVLTDFSTRDIVDIVKSRQMPFLREYFGSISEKERMRTKVFISDMYEGYDTICRQYFPKAIHIIDLFHVITQLTNAINRIRVQVMNTEAHKGTPEYNFMKQHWQFFLCRKSRIPNRYYTVKSTGETIHYTDLVFKCIQLRFDLSEGYACLQELFKYSLSYNFDEAVNFVERIVTNLEKTNNELLKKVAQTYHKWRYEIANGFDKKSRQMKYTNSLAEEKNNELKTIIKNAYGYNNFARFRKRAMMIMTYKNKKR